MQCTATNRSGERCRKTPLKGSSVCAMHGGSSKEARDGARRRLVDLVDSAIAALHDEMHNAEHSRDRIAAANSILDRAGVVKGADSDLETARTILIERLIALRGNQALEATAVTVTTPREVESSDDDIIDADYFDEYDE